MNPDEIEDHFRLHEDLPLIKNLAELAIEQKMGIKRKRTVWREHQYELEGFRKLFPVDVLEKIKASEPIDEDIEIGMPRTCTVIARRGVEVHAFQDMQCHFVGRTYGGIVLEYISEDGAILIRVLLDFSDNRLQFDPLHGLGFVPNHQNAQFLRYEIALLEFQECILSNGVLEVWDEESASQLGRTQPYIPCNLIVDHEQFDTERAMLREKLERLK